MSWKLILRLAELTISAILATSLFLAWRAERTARAKLATELSVAQQSLTQASDRQQSRDADLLRTLASLAAQKRDVQTPAQILQALPQQIPLPQPIVVAVPPTNPSTDSPQNSAAKPTPPEPQAVIPSHGPFPVVMYMLPLASAAGPPPPIQTPPALAYVPSPFRLGLALKTPVWARDCAP